MTKQPVGRPSLYKKEYCEELIEWMKKGKSFWTFAVNVPCTIDTLSEWTKVHPEFSEAKMQGKVYEMDWWDNVHRKLAVTGVGNITAVVWAQKNKFPKFYRERLAKGANQIELKQRLAVSGDFKSIVATMTPDQMYQLSIAMEQKVKEIEAISDKKDDKKDAE